MFVIFQERKKTEFGEYLVKSIRESGLSQAEFISKVGIARPYFYDMLKNSPPPKETLEKMINVFKEVFPNNEMMEIEIIDIAAKCRDEIPADINDMIKKHPEHWEDIRKMLLGIENEGE